MISTSFRLLVVFAIAFVALSNASLTPRRHQSTAAALEKRAGQPTKAPKYAKPTLFNMDGGSTLFAWQSKTPHDESLSEQVYISVHGVARDANTYFSAINSAYVAARGKNLAGAQGNVLRIAPLFFAAKSDASKLNKTTLAWSEDNDWAAGAASQHPDNVDISSLTVFDNLLEHYADSSAYPNMKKVTFVGHGGGALIIQRYAALRQRSSADSRVAIRYVIANPSTMLYFTKDRPEQVSESSCDVYNEFYYGLGGYDIPFKANTDNPSGLFQTYATRDVRYLVGIDDNSASDGDQSCGARAQGGPKRKNRSLSYWKYVNYLAFGAGSDQQAKLSKYPGNYTSLESGKSDTSAFRNSGFKHTLSQVSAGHDVTQVFTSSQGVKAIFG